MAKVAFITGATRGIGKQIAIEFAKAIINGQEVMIRHFSDGNGNIMVSEKIEFDNLPDILNFDIKLKINGKEYKDKLI